MALLSLKSCTDASVAEFIKLRYEDGEFQHALNNCYILVNPFHQLKRDSKSFLYDDPMVLQKYLLDPYTNLAGSKAFKFANDIYNTTVINGISQSVIFRGCCGTGKTEALKSVLQFLLCADSTKKDVKLNPNSLAPLGSSNNPLNLPSDASNCTKAISIGLTIYDIMGNSMTDNNNNSSRHLKHIKLVYELDGKLIGAQLKSYLTDLMRFDINTSTTLTNNINTTSTTTATTSQFNNPVYFMVLVATGMGNKAEKYKITKTHRDAYLPPGLNSKATQENLEKEFEYFQMNILSSGVITVEEWEQCLAAVAACINLQCVVLSGSECASISMSTKSFVANAEELIGLPPGSLGTLILKRPDDRIGRTAGSLIENKPAEGKVVLDALSRIIYGRMYKFCLQLFSKKSFLNDVLWLEDLNQDTPLSHSSSSHTNEEKLKKEIHFIDAPGWEQLDSTLPGQLYHLLLHYMEEKLHYDYIYTMYTEEIENYALEEIDMEFIEYTENSPLLDLFEKPSYGIIPLLEEASLQIKINDKALVDKILASHMKTKLIRAGGARASATSFLVKHSFADVLYECDNFTTQNKQSHLPDIAITTLSGSNIPFIAQDVALALSNNTTTTTGTTSASTEENTNKRTSLSRGKTPSTTTFLMTKTRLQINSLFETITNTGRLTYALCISTIKSSKDSSIVTTTNLSSIEYIKEQCKYYSIANLINFQQKGYSYNKVYSEFYKYYRIAVAYDTPNMPMIEPVNEDIIQKNAQELCRSLVSYLLPLLIKNTAEGSQLSEEDEPQYGRTSIFLRSHLYSALQAYRLSFIRSTQRIAIFFQSNYRMHKIRMHYIKIKRNIITMQAYIRYYHTNKLYKLKLYSINKIKSYYKMLIYRRYYLLMRSACNYIKSKYLGVMIVRIRYIKMKKARKILQSLGKGYLARINIINTIKSYNMIKKMIIKYIKKKKRLYLEYISSIIIQKYYRYYHIKRKYAHIIKILAIRKRQYKANKIVKKLQSLWRLKLIQKRFVEVIKASITIQTRVRSYIQTKQYKHIRKIIIYIQSKYRKYKAIQYIHTLIVNNMIKNEFYILNNLYKKEINNLLIKKNSERYIGSNYLRDGITKYSKFIISFNIYFDLHFSYPDTWLKTILSFQEKLKNLKKNIKKIIIGSHHTVILDDCDCIYTMGMGDFGQLGHNNRNSLEFPLNIEKLTNYLVNTTSSSSGGSSIGKTATMLNTVGRSVNTSVSVKDVCCGKDHTLLLSGAGLVYSWGDNRRGQLGHSRYESCAYPKLVGDRMSAQSTIRQLKHVRSICCGDYYSACLVDPGCVYTWGCGRALGRESMDPPGLTTGTARRGSVASVVSQSSGFDDSSSWYRPNRSRAGSVHGLQGLNDFYNSAVLGTQEKDSSQPEIVSFFQRRRIQYICSGHGHLIARVGSDVFAWGDNQYGQLGDGTRQSTRFPVQVLLPPLTESEANTCELVSGGHHNVLQVKGEIWCWGWNKYGTVGNGTIEDALRPVKIPILGTPYATATVPKPIPTTQYVKSLNAGLRHTLVLTSSQLLIGWGMVNLTNATCSTPPATDAGTSPAPAHTESRRRYSVLCDENSTSELYLTPTQIFYPTGPNPFSHGKLLQLRGCSSSSLSYVTVDAEVPDVADLSTSTTVLADTAPGARSVKRPGTVDTPQQSSSSKLSTTARSVRRALQFTSPIGKCTTKRVETDADENTQISTTEKPQFNPFSKDFSCKKEEQAALVKRMKAAVKSLHYIPGASSSSTSAADAKLGHTVSGTPSGEAKGTKRAFVTPNNTLKSVRTSDTATGNSVQHTQQQMRRVSDHRSPSSMSNVKNGQSGVSSPVGTGHSRLSRSLSLDVYGRRTGDRSLPEREMEDLTLTDASMLYSGVTAIDYMVPTDTATTATEAVIPFDEVAAQNKERVIGLDDLLDLFSPLHLASIRNHRGQRKRDVVHGTSVRDYFSIFDAKEVPPLQKENSILPKTGKAGPAASGVGMPITEKAFLTAYESTQKGVDNHPIQPTDGRIAAPLVKVTNASSTSATGSEAMTSYQTPTLSYSWRLASRRRSTTSMSSDQLPSSGADHLHMAAAAPVLATPSPRRASAASSPRSSRLSGHGPRSLSPKRTVNADPAASLGIDKAIEKLTKNLRSPAGDASRSKNTNT